MDGVQAAAAVVEDPEPADAAELELLVLLELPQATSVRLATRVAAVVRKVADRRTAIIYSGSLRNVGVLRLIPSSSKTRRRMASEAAYVESIPK